MPIPKDRKGLTIKQRQVVKAKVKAELADIPQSVVAQEVYPNQTPGAAAVSMTRELKKANVQEELEKAMVKHGITIEAATQPIADGLQAVKYYEANEDGSATTQPDHSIRLKASSMALKLMGAEKTEDKGGNTIIFSNNSTFNSNSYKE